MAELDVRANARMRLRLHHVGAESAPVLVIDDFAEDPLALVEAAADGAFAPVEGNLYPGLRTPAPVSYRRFLAEVLAGPVREGFDLAGLHVTDVESDFSIVTTRREQLALFQCLPHFDDVDLRQIAVMHFLCGAGFGGTAFYRHRATGFEIVSAEREKPYWASLGAGLKANGPPKRDYICADTVLYERVASFEAVFNRAVIYRSAALHSGDIGADFRFDPNPRTGRLSANTFLHFRAAGHLDGPSP